MHKPGRRKRGAEYGRLHVAAQRSTALERKSYPHSLKRPTHLGGHTEPPVLRNLLLNFCLSPKKYPSPVIAPRYFAALQDALAEGKYHFAALQNALDEGKYHFAELQNALDDGQNHFAALQNALVEGKYHFAALQNTFVEGKNPFAALQIGIFLRKGDFPFPCSLFFFPA